MTVVLNEAALEALLVSDVGAVGRFTREATERVREEALSRVKEVTGGRLAPRFASATGDLVGARVFSTPAGPVGEVGLTEAKSGSEYLLRKAKDEKGTDTPGDWAFGAAKVLEPLWTVE